MEHKHQPENRVLAALSKEEYQRLQPSLEPIHLARNRILYEAGDEIHHAYFLNNGVAALLAVTEDGQTVDVGTVGRDGLIGVPIALEVPFMVCRVVTQLPCEALAIRKAVLLAEFKRVGTLQRLLLRYAYVQQIQMIQSSVCHSLHTIQQRLCRWLLVIADSVQANSFNVTQEHIANMLGHQRNRITLAARTLLREGLVEYGGGSMKILNRPGMEAAACECYRIIKESSDRLM